MLQSIGSDFVPIKPYYADSVLVGIGQRHHIVVKAKPSDDLLPIKDQNYWIRAVVSPALPHRMVRFIGIGAADLGAAGGDVDLYWRLKGDGKCL